MWPTQLRVESLESRMMLAGDAMASVVNGNLMIQGDNTDNRIEISAGAEDGEFVVAGLAESDTSTGGSDETTFAGVTGSVVVMLGGGDDSLVVADVQIAGDLTVDGGSGSDTIQIGAEITNDSDDDDSTDMDASLTASVDIGGDLLIDAGSGRDLVTAAADVDGSANIQTGAGSDHVTVDGLLAADLKVDTGNGDDTLEIAAFSDTEAQVSLSTGNGDDTVDVVGLTGASLNISTGNGADVLNLGGFADDSDDPSDDDAGAAAGVEVSGEISIDTGTGKDEVTADVVEAASLSIATHQGVDTISISADLAAELGSAISVDSGPGHDLVSGVTETLNAAAGNAQGLHRQARLDQVFADLDDRLDDLSSRLHDLDEQTLAALAGNGRSTGQLLSGGHLNGLTHSPLRDLR